MAKNVQVIEPIKKFDNTDKDANPMKKKVCAYCRVSTDSGEQMESYNAQVDEYTKIIKENPAWEFVNVYADAGISGTNVKNRLAFNRMIKDCHEGKIDMIITKSISRFARNTVDCLNHVRLLKNKGVEVFFEKENIYTFDPKVELLLTMMSSIAQEESRNISENSKWGIKKRFRDGVAICNTNRLLGYDKDDNGNLIVNEEQAKIVRRIYKEYLDGKGYGSIARGLTDDGIITVAGGKSWYGSTISKILSNEKYKGDLLLQKTVTVDYLSHKRVKNENLEPQYIIEDNHEPIISKAIWEQVQLEKKRRYSLTCGSDPKNRTKYTNKYAFSSKLYCGKCGRTLKRRKWNAGTKSEKIMWQCNNYIKGIENCDSKAVSDTILKETFVKVYNDMLKDKGSFIKNFMKNVEKVLAGNKNIDRINSVVKQISELEQDLKGLIQLQIKGKIDEKYYDEEYKRIKIEIDKLNDKRVKFEEEHIKEVDYKQRIDAMMKILNRSEELLTEFDDEIFNAVVKKVNIKSPDHFVFILENSLEYDGKSYSSKQHATHVETCVRLTLGK